MSRHNRKGNTQNQQDMNRRTPGEREQSWNNDNGSNYANGGVYNSDSNDRNPGPFSNDGRELTHNNTGTSPAMTRNFDAFGDETEGGGYPRRNSSFMNADSNRYNSNQYSANQNNTNQYNRGGNTQYAQQDRSTTRQDWDNEGGYTGTAQTNEMHSGNADAQRRFGQQSFGQSNGGQSYAQAGRYGSEGRSGYDNRGSQSVMDTDLGASPSKRGTAPRSYKRSDERLNEDVCEALMARGLDCSSVDVAVSGGVVTLSGEVSNRSDRLRMEHVAAEVSGVSDVENQLRISGSTNGISAAAKSGSETTQKAGETVSKRQ